MLKLGKNVSCPCGSGKKYGKCCGAKVDNVIDLEARRWQVLADDLHQKVINYVNGSSLDQIRDDAFQEFFGDEESQMDDYLWERFMDWLIFDYYPEEGVEETLIRRYREELDHSLDDRSREVLKQWEQAVISLYEVIGVESGRGVTLKDLLQGGQREVLDEDFSKNIEVRSLLVTRLLPVNKDYRFSMGATILPPYLKSTLLKEIRSDYLEFLKYLEQDEEPCWNTYLREWGFDIETMVEHLSEELSGDEHASAKPLLSPRVEEFLRDLVLDEYYRQWIDKPISTLEGRTPREVIRSEAGRLQLEKILRKMAARGGREEDAGDGPAYNVVKLRKMLGLSQVSGLTGTDWSSWSFPEYHEVARKVEKTLEKARFTPEQVTNAIRLWYDFSVKERPRFRKPEVWAAAVIYTCARLEFDNTFTQHGLAKRFGVSANGISTNYCRIREVLDLDLFDSRYCSLTPPVDGLEEFLAWLLH